MTSRRQLTTRYGLIALVWFLSGLWWLLLVGKGAAIPEGFIKPISIISLLLPLFLFGFEHWGWRWVGVLTEHPDLRGTWTGTFQSNYVDPDTNEQIGPREVFMVIHQTYSGLHLRQLTSESSSVTLAATLVDEPDGRHTIWGVFRNQPKIELRERSPIHRGGLQLNVTGPEEDQLEGEYWTDRGTHGSLALTRVSRTQARDFVGAQALVTNNQ